MTGKVATIVPIAHLDLIQNHEYFMALSYMCEKDQYARWHYDRAMEGKYVILDNSTVELGAPEDLQTYVEKAIAIRASEILLPDWFQDSIRTLQDCWVGIESARSLGYRGRFQAVPQGKTDEEWFGCLRAMLAYGEIGTIGLSRRYAGPGNLFTAGRLGLTVRVRSEIIRAGRENEVTIHWLGQLHHPLEERVWMALNHENVQGIDSSLPTLATRCGDLLTEGWTRPPDVRPPEFLIDSYDPRLMFANIQRWRALCGS